MKFINWKSSFWELAILLFIGLSCNCDDTSNACSECFLEPDPGPCEAYFPRYYFDQAEKQCKEFIWGGCDGVVPFETMEACEQCACNE